MTAPPSKFAREAKGEILYIDIMSPQRGVGDRGVTLLSNFDDESAETGATETILLVDDNRLVRSSLAMMLEDIGYAVIEAERGEQALSLLGDGSHVDAALVDFRLPDMNGLALAAKLRAQKPDLRLVMVSGQPIGPEELASIPGARVSMLLKPFNAKQLEDLLEASL